MRMTNSFTDIIFPETLKVSSEGSMIPFDFFGKVIPLSKKIQLKLGYFNSNAISSLSCGFAQFIYNGGEIELLTNHFLEESDFKNLMSGEKLDKGIFKKIEQDIILDLKNLESVLQKKEVEHFYNCLRYLIEKGRMKLIPVRTIDNQLSHYKEGLFWDENNNILNIVGSCNFTYSGILVNGESFTISRSWGEKSEIARINEEMENYRDYFTKNSNKLIYLESGQIEKVIYDNSKKYNLDDLLEHEKELLMLKVDAQSKDRSYKNKIENIKRELEENFISFVNQPRFPYARPYDYQIAACQKWNESNRIGLFEMATGTGKTLTALLCLIEEFKKTGIERNIFVVPGKELVRQWKSELEACNFNHIFTWFSENTRLNKDIQSIKLLIKSLNQPLNIIITYDSFNEHIEFQKIFKNDLREFSVVFDECHNMGAIGFMQKVEAMKFGNRIGLSATPMRDWDEQGSNDFIMSFFNSEKPIFEFPMKKAIGKFLCPYNYYPFFCFFEEEEWDEYKSWTKKIPRAPKDMVINQNAAMKRQAVVDKAIQKREVLIKILGKLLNDQNISNTLVYCPKGIDKNDDVRLIHLLGEMVADVYQDEINAQFFVGETEERELLLEQFDKKEVDILYAIKCLDEGVNVPSTRNAIFIASGKNEREFIQRRGRVLRLHPSSGKTEANIFDIIILPTITQYDLERNYAEKILIGEFGRLSEFMEISQNKTEAEKEINNHLSQIGLTYSSVKDLIEENDKRTIT